MHLHEGLHLPGLGLSAPSGLDRRGAETAREKVPRGPTRKSALPPGGVTRCRTESTHFG